MTEGLEERPQRKRRKGRSIEGEEEQRDGGTSLARDKLYDEAFSLTGLQLARFFETQPSRTRAGAD